MKPKKPWKQNLRTISPQIWQKVKQFNHNTVVAGCTIRLNPERIQQGVYAHLGITWQGDKPSFPDKIVPPSGVGRFSRYNREGREVVYRDRPMTLKTWSIESPNYGEWEKGTHDVEFSKEVYQREFFAPKLVAIAIKLIGEDFRSQSPVFSFTVEEVLDRHAEVFTEDLLFNLNLLQENVGNHGVFESNATVEDYLRSLYVNWEFLPLGEREDVVAHILALTKSSDPEVRKQIIERSKFLLSLRPQNILVGTSEFRRYFGAQFANDLVVFENIEYGNAIYVMFDEWQELSKKSRTELLSSRSSNFVRIPHTKTWKLRLRSLISEERAKRKRNVG